MTREINAFDIHVPYFLEINRCINLREGALVLLNWTLRQQICAERNDLLPLVARFLTYAPVFAVRPYKNPAPWSYILAAELTQRIRASEDKSGGVMEDWRVYPGGPTLPSRFPGHPDDVVRVRSVISLAGQRFDQPSVSISPAFRFET